MEIEQQRIDKALKIASYFGQIEGDHHRLWVIDQMVRALTGESYEHWVKNACFNEDNPRNPYEWDTGIAP